MRHLGAPRTHLTALRFVQQGMALYREWPAVYFGQPAGSEIGLNPALSLHKLAIVVDACLKQSARSYKFSAE